MIPHASFNSRVREGATEDEFEMIDQVETFNSRAREGATCGGTAVAAVDLLSIRAPVRARLYHAQLAEKKAKLSIRAPVRARHHGDSGMYRSLFFQFARP